MQQQLHTAFASADLQSSRIVTLEEQLRTQDADANDLLSVMKGMRETMSQQQGAISKLVAKRARAEEHAAMAEERCKKLDATVEQQSQRILELQTQLKDAAISIQLHQAISERVGTETCSLQAVHQQKISDMKESLKLQLQQVEAAATLSQERLCGELESMRVAHASQLQQLRATHERELGMLQRDLEQAQQSSVQLTHDLNHAQADAIDLLQKCDTLRQSIAEDAATHRSKLSLASAAASQAHSEMVAAQQARLISEAAVVAIDTQNKLLLCQIEQLSSTVSSLRAELDQQQKCSSVAASSARSAGIAQQVAESELQLEKEATLLHRSRADTAEKLLEESARMRADVQVVFATASDELAEALETFHGSDSDTSTAYLACRACLQMLRHTRPVLVDPCRHDAAIHALQDICTASASQAGKRVASMAVAAADAMREADELRSRCCDQEQQLQAYLVQSVEAASFCEELHQMHVRIDSMTEALEEEHRRHQMLVAENKNLEFLCLKAAAEAASAMKQRDEDAAELHRSQRALYDLQGSSAAAEASSSQEISHLTASVAVANSNSQKYQASAATAQVQVAVLETRCFDLQAKLDLSVQEASEASIAAETSAAIASNLQEQCSSLLCNSTNLASDIETWRLAAQTAEVRLQEAQDTARIQREQAMQQLNDTQRSAEIEIARLNLALADSNGRIDELSKCISELQKDLSDEKIKSNQERQFASAAAAQIEADHAQLLRDCEMLHAYHSETLQELQQLQESYDRMLAERDEIEVEAAAHAEEQEKRLNHISEVAAAAESERAQLLQHLHLSQQENLQLHRQQQRDEREKISLQSAVTLQNEALQQEAATRVLELQVVAILKLIFALLVRANHVACREKLRRCRLQMLICQS